MLWNNIKGHQEVKRTLTKQIKAGRVGHAYLFVGSHGIGKHMVATAFATGLICGLGQNIASQTKGLSCSQRIIKNIHPDVRIWQTDKKKFSVSDIRAWQKDVWLPPTVAEKKVVIVDKAERLTLQAQNALLKILEEPPSDTVFILLTDNTSELLSTVISRCRLIRFGKLTHNELKEVFDTIFVEKDNIDLLFHICSGSPGQALALSSKVDLTEVVTGIASIIDLLSNKDISGLFNEVSNLISNNVDIEILLYALETIWAMALRQDKDINDIISNDSSYFLNKPLWELKNDCQSIINARKQISRYQNKQLVMETLLLNILEENNG